MNWTTEKPTQLGWYWWRYMPGEQMIVEVVDNEHGLYALFPYQHRNYNALVAQLRGEWSSEPLATPEAAPVAGERQEVR